MGISSERLSQVVGTRFPVCSSSSRALRRCRSSDLVVGSVERTRHWLLEGDARRVFQALRLYGRGRATSVARGEHWWAGQRRGRQSESGGFSPLISRSLCTSEKLRYRRRRSAARLHQLSSQG